MTHFLLPVGTYVLEHYLVSLRWIILLLVAVNLLHFQMKFKIIIETTSETITEL